MSDAGMCGDYDSVLGMEKEEPIRRFLQKTPGARFEPASGEATLSGVAVETDDAHRPVPARSRRSASAAGCRRRARLLGMMDFCASPHPIRPRQRLIEPRPAGRTDGTPMAGHSQFANIMHRKGKQDAKRSKLFSKLAREITVAAKMGLPDPAMNARLRAAILAARVENMPKDNIDRAIKKAPGGDGENYDEIRYEGYGPGGVALIVEALTDNRNRTASDIRSYFTKAGGNLAETGAVAFMFDRVGVIEFDARQGQRRRHAGGGDRGRRRRLRHLRGRPRVHLRGGRRSPTSRRRSRSASASRASPASSGAPRTPSRVDDEAGEKLLGSSTRSTTMTTSRTSTPISRSPRRCWRRSPEVAAIRILGIDPGLRRTGWGVIETEGSKLVFVACGTVISDDKDELSPPPASRSMTGSRPSSRRTGPTRRRSRRPSSTRMRRRR